MAGFPAAQHTSLSSGPLVRSLATVDQRIVAIAAPDEHLSRGLVREKSGQEDYGSESR